MPRQSIEIETPLETLSVLDAEGGLDEELEPEIPEETLLRMHRQMVLGRRFSDRMRSLQQQGRIGTFAPVRGQEAAQIGAVAAIEDDDWVVQSYREIALNAWRGLPLEGTLLYNAGYNEGGAIPEDHRDLPPSVPVGTQMLHAAGIAYASRLREEGRVVLTTFGDGATSEGDFHEALNFAAVFRCPVVFLCQNNQYAISVPRTWQTTSPTLAQKGLAYAIPSIQVDGNDVLAVYVAASEAVERAREEGVPTLIEAVTYRLDVHTTVDDPSKYRPEEEEEEWEARDPLPRFQDYLKERGLLEDDDVEAVEQEVDEEIDAAIEAWEAEMERLDGPEAMFDHVWADPPPYLRAQRDAFEREQRERGEEAAAEEGKGDGSTDERGAQASAGEEESADGGEEPEGEDASDAGGEDGEDGSDADAEDEEDERG